LCNIFVDVAEGNLAIDCHQRRSCGQFAHRGKRFVLIVGRDRLQKYTHQAVTTDTKSPELFVILAEIVSNRLRRAGLQHRTCAFGEVSLQTATG
jgi:hypothetical protein